MAICSLRIGVPVVGLAQDEQVHFMKPTTGGVKFSYLMTKTAQVEVEVGFTMLGEAKDFNLVPGDLYHLVVTMPPDNYGFCEVRQAKQAKCGTIVTSHSNNGAPTTQFTFTFPESQAETNGEWRDVLIYGKRPKQDTDNSGEAPETMGS